MAIKVGRADAVVLSTDTVGTNIDINVGFTPTAGQWFVFLYWSGRTESTDTVGATDINVGKGMAVSSTSRRVVCGFSQNGVGTSVSSHHQGDDAVLKVLNSADTVVGALDIVGEVTNGIRLVVDDQFPADVRFQVLVIDGLTGASIFNITEPGVTGNADHTGAGVDNADLSFFMNAGGNLAANGTGVALRQTLGAAHADGQFVSVITTRDAQVTMDTHHYGTDVECLAFQGVAGTILSRASFVASIVDGVRLNWLERSGTHIHFCAVLKGIEATVQSGLTQADTTTDIVVTGLGNTCLGGIVVSNCEAESTQDTGGTHHHSSIGSFVSTSNRGCHATWDEDATLQAECATGVEYDEVYANISSADAIQGLMDIKSLDSGGATFIMDDADPAQKWFGMVLFADPVVAVIETPRNLPQMPLIAGGDGGALTRGVFRYNPGSTPLGM